MKTPWLNDDQLTAWLGMTSVIALLPNALDSQLRRDSGLTHFEYMVLSMLSEAPDRTMRMTHLAGRTTATLPRLSHVVRRLDDRGLVTRSQCADDARATNVQLSAAGWEVLVAAAPGHVEAVRSHVIDALTDEQIGQLTAINAAILERLDPQVPPTKD